MIQAIQTMTHFSLLLSHLLLMFIIALSTGCMTPNPAPKTAVVESLTPWTPTRHGNHPGLTSPLVVSQALTRHPRDEHYARGPVQATAYLAWRLYSNSLSRVSGDTCRFSPTCSRFALDATAGGPEGLVLTFGRLMRHQLNDPLYHDTPDGALIDPPDYYFFWRSPLGRDAHRYQLERRHAWYLFVSADEDLP